MEAIEPGALRTGALLSAAREAAGIDLVDLARESRVPLRHLKAIEADSHASLPALPYTIGFVKTFARAVGLDPEATALQFRAETTKVAHVPTVPSLEPLDERRVPSRSLAMASVVIIALIIAGRTAGCSPCRRCWCACGCWCACSDGATRRGSGRASGADRDRGCVDQGV